jgi:putative DNA primase/helicase
MKKVELTDAGNAQRFVATRAEELRHVGSWSKWMHWDGRRWTIDEVYRVEHLAKETVKEMFEVYGLEMSRAQNALKSAEESGNETLAEVHKDRMKAAAGGFRWAIESHSSTRIKAIPSLAKSAPELAVSHDQLDADPWLLNCQNGTLDLRTQQLRPHQQADLITKLAPIDYDPSAKCPVWDAFLHRAMAGNAELLGFIQRMVGYALTGVIREHALVFLHGEGANGKSTFLVALQAMMGDYAVQAPRGMLFESRGQRHETELTTLFGRRFVSCPEIAKDSTWDEALVKDLTGGDVVTARRMREDHWSFSPTHKLFIAGNHKPRVRGNDEGIWRRLRLVPWSVIVPEAERDTTLSERLLGELPGILAWAVRGCLEWQKNGLGASDLIGKATAEYREESDPMKEFFDLHCIFEPDARIARKTLRHMYEEFCKDNGAEPVNAKRLAESLRAKSVTNGKVKLNGKPADGWSGVRMATDAERDRETSKTGDVIPFRRKDGSE